MTEHTPAGHPKIPSPQVGVLLVNLGTPPSLQVSAIRRYLDEFLSDRRVVELPPLLWQPILKGIILNTRPPKTAKAYAKVWDRARDLSPLAAFTMDQCQALAARLPGVAVDWAMRYGQPSIAARLAALMDAGCRRILLAPLYPQYSAATTGTVVDAAGRTLAGLRWQPALRTLPPYYDDPAHIAALAASVRTHLAGLAWTPDVLVASFHGMPRRTLDLGDPYHCQCQKTGRLLREALGWPAERFRVTFQSRFGPAAWLQPYTDKTLEALPGEGAKAVAVVSPGFAVDCIETLEEIAIAGAETFHAAGGAHYTYIPCLNATETGMAMLETLVRRELSGWM
ncbi:MAG: ferrochelatase [Sphingomonadales bacterium]|nr:MAG: ferrochelatase [Sphingomonadales bacterium]